MAEKMHYTEFAKELKAKFPESSERDDLELVQYFIKNNPDFKSHIDMSSGLDLELPLAKDTSDVTSVSPDYKPTGKVQKEDPMVMAQKLAKLHDVPLQTARERVAGFPRSAAADLRGESFSPMANLGDIFSAGGRGISALMSDEDPLTAMARIDPKGQDVEGKERGFWSMLGESILRDPASTATLPLGGPIKNVVQKVAPQALKSGSRLANAGLKAIEGIAGTGTDIAFEQATRPEELGNLSPEALGYSLLGGGTLGATAGALSKTGTKAVPSTPVVAKTGREAEQNLTKDFLASTGFTDKEIANLPKESQGVLKTITPPETKRFEELLIKAEEATRDPLLETPFEEVGKKWIQGEELIKQAKSDAGKTLGNIEDEFLGGSPIPTEKIWEKWNNQLEKFGVQAVEDEGVYVIQKIEGNIFPDKNTKKALQELTEEIAEIGEEISPTGLRQLEKNIAGSVNYGSATRSGITNKPVDVAAKGLKKDIKDLVYSSIRNKMDEGIETNSIDPTAIEIYEKARKDYGKFATNLDELQRSIGKIVASEGESSGSRGANMTKAMLNRATNKNTRALADLIEELDPSLNLKRESVMSDIAMKAAKTPRGGKRFELPSTGVASNVGKVMKKISQPKDFNTSMLSDLLQTQQKRQVGAPSNTIADMFFLGGKPVTREAIQTPYEYE